MSMLLILIWCNSSSNNALDSTIVISNQRLTLAQNRFTIGKASKLPF
jgi:hypothetical protein